MRVEVVDAAGRVVPTASDVVSLSVTGRGGNALAFLGGGNGDPSGLTPDKSATRPAFHGLLLGVLVVVVVVVAVVVVVVVAPPSMGCCSVSSANPNPNPDPNSTPDPNLNPNPNPKPNQASSARPTR